MCQNFKQQCRLQHGMKQEEHRRILAGSRVAGGFLKRSAAWILLVIVAHSTEPVHEYSVASVTRAALQDISSRLLGCFLEGTRQGGITFLGIAILCRNPRPLSSSYPHVNAAW